jgi:hypothetical protein
MFYGGGKPAVPGLMSRESIGYAYSFDGLHWTKYGRNPVAVREAEFNASAFAEVQALYKPPFVYCYHSLRFAHPLPGRENRPFPSAQDLGVQVLAVQRPFALEFPVLNKPRIEAGQETTLAIEDTRCVPLGNIANASLTFECRFDPAAKNGVRIHVRSSLDGGRFDTEDFISYEVSPSPGQQVCQTFRLPTEVRFVKVLIENLDPAKPITDTNLSAMLRG